MLRLKKFTRAMALALALTLTAPAGVPMSQTTVAEAATIKLNAKKKSLKVGKTYTLKVSGTKKKVTWSSDKKSVATVNSKGKVTAKKAGTATITAKVAGKKLTCKITVTKPENKYVAKAPFKAKEIKLGKFTAAAPTDWTLKETEISGIPAYMLVSGKEEEVAGGASILVTSTVAEGSKQENFDLLKAYLEEFLTEDYLKSQIGETTTISNFTQEVVEIELGKAIKTSYTVTIEADETSYSFVQAIYDVFANGYTTEVTVTSGMEATTPDIQEVGAYLTKSLIYNK